jgi:hypothetical protein
LFIADTWLRSHRRLPEIGECDDGQRRRQNLAKPPRCSANPIVVSDEVPAIFGGLEKMISICLVLIRLSVALQLLRDPMTTLLVGVQPDAVRENLRQSRILDMAGGSRVEDFFSDALWDEQPDPAGG